jgi:transposase
MRRLEPDYRTIAAFRRDFPGAIVAASAAFVQVCREQGLVGGRMVALDGTKMRAVASPKNTAGAERLARDIASLQRRKGRLVRRQQELGRRDEKVLVFGEPEAKPMGYAHAPKLPSYNLQSVVDVASGLIVHHNVYNDANDSHLLHPMSMGTKEVLDVESRGDSPLRT